MVNLFISVTILLSSVLFDQYRTCQINLYQISGEAKKESGRKKHQKCPENLRNGSYLIVTLNKEDYKTVQTHLFYFFFKPSLLLKIPPLSPSPPLIPIPETTDTFLPPRGKAHAFSFKYSGNSGLKKSIFMSPTRH